MLKIRTDVTTKMKLTIEVIMRDIEEGKCGLKSLCMYKVAIERTLRARDPKGGDHKVKIDAGVCRFNFQKYKWVALVPKQVARNLIQYDNERKARAKAEAAGLKFVSKVKPHKFILEAERKQKVEQLTRERQEQINKARNQRKAEGRPDRRNYDLHYRVQGMGAV